MTDPITELMTLSLKDEELAFIYFGWAGILLRAKQKTLAFDLSEFVLEQNNLKLESITMLDLQLNSHIHKDHFDLKGTTQFFMQTGARIVADPLVFEELKKKIPEEALFIGNPYKPLNVGDFKINAIEGRHPSPITLFRVRWNDVSIFHGADSDHVPLENYLAEIAFIPTGSPSPSCSPEKGLKMVLDVQPSIVVATHGTGEQMKEFEALVKKEMPETEVVIPERKKLIKVSL
ncbi:MAG: MBL fold metallo-hydrolase [Candidatus Odinarchaeota archaeon]